LLSLCKDDCLCISSIAYQYVSKSRHPVLEGAFNSQMVHMSCSLVFQIHCKIDNSETFFHILASNAFYPTWNRSRKKANLQLSLITYFSNVLQDSVHILFEAKLQHLVSLIENHRLDSFKIYISSLDVIQNSACCTNKDVNTLSQLSDLLINIDASINCNKSEFII